MTAERLSPEAARYRTGYLIAFAGTVVVMGTVHIWDAPRCCVMTYLGAGSWFYTSAAEGWRRAGGPADRAGWPGRRRPARAPALPVPAPPRRAPGQRRSAAGRRAAAAGARPAPARAMTCPPT